MKHHQALDEASTHAPLFAAFFVSLFQTITDYPDNTVDDFDSVGVNTLGEQFQLLYIMLTLRAPCIDIK
jgi:hypothetical protein